MPVHGWHRLCSLISAQSYQGPQMPGLLEQSQSYHLALHTFLDSTQLARPATPKAATEDSPAPYWRDTPPTSTQHAQHSLED